MNRKTKALCEAAMMIAIALILNLLKDILPGRLPNGGSILNISMLPIVLFAVRHGILWGTMAGFLYGGLNYILGSGMAIDWTTLLCDYFLAFAMLGLGAGIFHKNKFGVYLGTVLGGSLQFITSYLVGVFVWGRWMPESFLGMAMTSPWLYSFLYNILWALPNILATLLVFAALAKPLKKFIYAEDIR